MNLRQMTFPFYRDLRRLRHSAMELPAYEQESIAPFMPGVMTRGEADAEQRRVTKWPRSRRRRSR